MQTKNINQHSAITVAADSTENPVSTSCSPLSQLTIRPQYEIDGNNDKGTIGESCKVTLSTASGFKMPPQPLYNDPASIPGSTTSSLQQMHTHSNKFPIEREVIIGNYDKNSKIPILNEYHKKHKDSTKVPDVPNIRLAWTENRMSRNFDELRNASANLYATDNMNEEFQRTYKIVPLSLPDRTEPCSKVASQADSNGSTIDGRADISMNKAFTSRTYNTIKDMISSRFGKSKIEQCEVNLNNNESNRNENISTVVPESGSSTYVATKTDNISNRPHRSQLVQRGVYLALAVGSQQRETCTTDTVFSDLSQERATVSSTRIHRERAIDVGDQRIIDDSADPVHELNTPITKTTSTSNLSVVPTRPPPTERSHEASNQCQDRVAKCENNDSICPDSMQLQNERDKVARSNEIREPHCSKHVHAAQHTAVDHQRVNEHARVDVTADYRSNGQPFRVDRHRTRRNPLDDDVTNSVELSCLSKIRRNGMPSTSSIYGEKDPSIGPKSKSLENLDSNDDRKIDKIEQFKTNTSASRLTFDLEKYRCGFGHSDSGRGSTVYSSGKLKHTTDTSPDLSEPRRTASKDAQRTHSVENDLRHILETKSNRIASHSTLSESSISPPLPHLTPDASSDEITTPMRQKELLHGSVIETTLHKSAANSSHFHHLRSKTNTKEKMNQRLTASTTKYRENCGKISSTIGSSSIDLDSIFDEDYETNDEEIDFNDNRAIRKQLKGLENMYSEVVKLLGVKKTKYATADSRLNRKPLYGSVSSLPSSISSRPTRHRSSEDRKKIVRDINGINKRFQRLESHVVTLARSVAHLSSEMRTQHIMIQEMELIRAELTNLRAQSNSLMERSQSISRYNKSQITSKHINSDPNRMKKLTKFFGDEPPLLGLFLKKLGYEKYASLFEKERIGLVELPYMTEERLQKLGIPMGPRSRIIQEARLGSSKTHENVLCII